jgi:K(+)-stimulated pyrophosphate-energized sodium pump
MLAFLVVGIMGTASSDAQPPSSGGEWHPFSFWTDPYYDVTERVLLLFNVIVAFGGLAYAWMLVKEVRSADIGNERMQFIARAVREGAGAYLSRQFKTVGILIVLITIVLVATKWPAADDPERAEHLQVALGRGLAFLFGSIFSATVGFVGMRLATEGNLRVAAAAPVGFGYRTGTITGMLTDGLGLLGGSIIFLYFGEQAYEALLGFGFGGTLLALFMRVGGGIYTKAADVGADLVGKIEAGIPEDDPRNAATIADNVGDNVGDCAGMAADIFESYEVTIVAAMILGYASFGHKGVIFPLLVRAIGVIGSIISTYTVKAEDKGGAKEAMHAVERGFVIGSIISVVGFLLLGVFYLNFDKTYIINQAVERGLYKDVGFQAELNQPQFDVVAAEKRVDELRHIESSKVNQEEIKEIALKEAKIDKYRREVVAAWKKEVAANSETFKKTIISEAVFKQAQVILPLDVGIDMRPAYTCLVGILLAIALLRCTAYWTDTAYEPVKSLAKSCRTGHATNIIQGIAVGYESTVWAVLIIAVAIFGSVVIYSGAGPVFVAYGVAMCGIGMLTLTGNTVSMDVFGPVADNANGIGEMGYNKDAQGKDLREGQPGYMPPEEYKRCRQILADLDAVGNTTKAITKGVAIGSAVIAAVSLFASFIAVMAKGTEEGINQLTTGEFNAGAAHLTVADPYVFIGLLIGGAVPFLFSSMTIRAVGRAAYLIVQECRAQFRDKDIWEGNKDPNYARVVDICTATAQKELVGPGLLAMFTPVFVGFLLGPYALGGFLAGMILVGQLLAVFMANAGGAWDNAKKTIEDQPKGPMTGKGSEQHKASVTGDTVGDPLKDTAGPAINPLIKVMNMVSLLILPLVLHYSLIEEKAARINMIGVVVVLVALACISWAWWQSKHETEEMKKLDEEFERAAVAAAVANK